MIAGNGVTLDDFWGLNSRMQLSQETAQNVTIITPEGRLDAQTAAAFEAQALAIVTEGAHRLLIDGTKLDYMSSAGLRALLAVTKKVRSLSGSIGLCHLQPQLKEIIEIAGFQSLIPVYPDRTTAVAGLA